MPVYLFRANGRVFGVTADESGANLPEVDGPWQPFKTLDLERGLTQPGLDVEECLDDLEAHGMHLTDAHVRITDSFV
ncbi:hypothetical protein BH10PSE2_BH10PSE2_18600 [soil metagenome]